jgi:hypothetical protein
MNTIYLKTAKAERESIKLSVELKRVLSLLDGRSGSDDLAKRAAPSLRKMRSVLINELVKGGVHCFQPRSQYRTEGQVSAQIGSDRICERGGLPKVACG